MPIQHSVRHGKRHAAAYMLSIALSAVLGEVFKYAMPTLMGYVDSMSDALRHLLRLNLPAELISMMLIGIGVAFLIGIVHGYQDWRQMQG